jgi:hypothetical protein
MSVALLDNFRPSSFQRRFAGRIGGGRAEIGRENPSHSYRRVGKSREQTMEELVKYMKALVALQLRSDRDEDAPAPKTELIVARRGCNAVRDER